MNRIIIPAFALGIAFAFGSAFAACAGADDYRTLKAGEYQIPGHPYKSAKNCPRTAPIGKFDRRCDIPLLGFRNFTDPTIIVQSGGVGGFGISGF